LSDTKASDKKTTLLHFIVKTVQAKFPDIANFDTELKYVEKAATGSVGQRLPKLCLRLKWHIFDSPVLIVLSFTNVHSVIIEI